MLARLNTFAMACSLIITAGCVCSNSRDSSCPVGQPPPILDCESVESHPYAVDVSQLGELSAAPTPEYCELREEDVQCLAAINSKIGNLIEREADAVFEQTTSKLHYANPNFSETLILLWADHQRNEDAAKAMELFYRLVEAESGDYQLGLQLTQFDQNLKNLAQLEQRGVLPPVSKSEITSQRLEVEHRRVELRTTIERLNLQLAALFNLQLPAEKRFWPEADLTVDPRTPSTDDAVMTAFGNRADLVALRMAANAEGRDSLVASQLLLPQSQPGLGGTSSLGRLAILHREAQYSESDIRAEQLAMLLVQREQTIRDEITLAVSLVHARLSQVDLTNQRITILRERVETLWRQREMVASAQVTLNKVQADLLTAEQSLVHDVVEWKIAVMKLRQAQGLLGRECGFDRAACCN